jgi:hypothetical protein
MLKDMIFGFAGLYRPKMVITVSKAVSAKKWAEQ